MLQLVAPQEPPPHAAVQQLPVPEAPQAPDTHWMFAVHAPPAATVESASHAPEALQKTPVPWQSALEAHVVLQAVALAQTKPPGQAAAVTVLQPLVLQVAAGVSMPPLHEAAAQVVGEPPATQPFVALQVCAGVNVSLPVPPHEPAAQVCGVPAVHVPEPLQVPAGVNVSLPVPPHDAEPHDVVLPGNTHAPEVLQAVAPQAPPMGSHTAVQQLPDPATSQTPDEHWLFAVHAPPAATSDTQAPAELQKTPVPAQSALEAHVVLQAVALPQMRPPGQAAAVPAVHVLFVVLHVPAGVNMLPLHVATAQSALVLQPTQPAVLQVDGQVWGVPETQPAVRLHVCAGVKVPLLHEAAAQVTAVAATQTWLVQAASGV